MKESYNIEVAGVQLSIVSSDGAEFVTETVAVLEESIRNMLLVGKNFSKLDAVALAALDYCGEYRKAESKIKNLEAQVEILEANIRRLRENSLATVDEVTETVEDEVNAETTDTTALADETADDTVETASEISSDTTADKKDEADESDAEDSSNDSSRDAKFRQLEAFLGSQLKFDLGDK